MTFPDLNSGVLAPVLDEIEVTDLSVTGLIPADLNGCLLRNGPNPFSGRFEGESVLDWWPEAAMLHSLSISGGEATAYRNRWVRTQAWAAARLVDNPESYVASNPNVNVIRHAGSILALAEGGVPVAIDTGLNTLGMPESHPGLADGMTAHPKIDPASGELLAFRQSWAPPYLHYMVFDSSGQRVVSQDVDMASPSMMHDMAITERWSVFLDLSVSIDFALLEQGFRMPIRWFDDRPSRIGLIPRAGGDVTWVEIEPCFILHVVNAYDADDGSVVMDVVRAPCGFRFDEERSEFEANPLAKLWRYRIDPAAGHVRAEQLDPANMELPRIDESHTGRAYRFLYAVEQPSSEEMRGVVKYDLERGCLQRYAVRHGDQNSEPIFVPRPDADSEDDGWLLVCVYRAATDTTDVEILDAKNISQDPIATIHIPRRIPAGFHGAWIDAC